MVYSVDRTFILQFMPSNTLDSFSGPNYTTVAILENGKILIIILNNIIIMRLLLLLFKGLQFLNIINLDGTMQLSQSDDVFSDPIYIRDGIPVGTTAETTAYVSKIG